MISNQKETSLATQWLLSNVGTAATDSITHVYLIICPKTRSKGTGFLLSSGHLITNEHVVRGSEAEEIVVISPLGARLSIQRCVQDQNRDLAALIPKEKIFGGLNLSSSDELRFGEKIHTWGFPFDHSGPAPLFSEGCLAGFKSHNGQKRYIINGAFNPGNSGGALFKTSCNEVIGVVVAKQNFTLPPFLASALDALSKNSSGVVFTAQDDQGNTHNLVESQIVAELLLFYRTQTQVMLGEAIAASELTSFLADVAKV